MSAQVACRVHGPMKFRFDRNWWECPGFDGEGCRVVRAEEVACGTASDTPNVEVKP